MFARGMRLSAPLHSHSSSPYVRQYATCPVHTRPFVDHFPARACHVYFHFHCRCGFVFPYALPLHSLPCHHPLASIVYRYHSGLLSSVQTLRIGFLSWPCSIQLPSFASLYVFYWRLVLPPRAQFIAEVTTRILNGLPSLTYPLPMAHG